MRTYLRIKRWYSLHNVTGICCVVSLILIYISLLRFNKTSSSTFNLNPKPRVIRSPIFDRRVNRQYNRSPGGVRNKKFHSRAHIYVVEEHHEVLPVWFDAVSSGYMKPHGNTLIHIDGHSDITPPFFFSKTSALKKEKKNLDTVKSQNDAFIVEAAMAGLLKKVIWIWPHWENSEHQKMEESIQMQVGWAVVNTIKKGHHKVFCLCYPNKTSTECVYLSLADSRLAMPINADLCHVKKSFWYKEIHENTALNKLQDKKLVTDKDESILLDIDEDYFGCVHAAKPLIDANITIKLLQKIDSILKKIICVEKASSEKFVDSVITTSLVSLRKYGCANQSNATLHFVPHDEKKVKESQKKTGVSCDKKLTETVQTLKKTLKSAPMSLLCVNNDGIINKLLTDFLHAFQGLNPKQQLALLQVGFCMSSTPQQSKEDQNVAFSVCHGISNQPTDRITTHVPTRNDISQRTLKLNTILSSMKKPSIITVCRSIRDGCTPRKYFSLIENSIMKSLNTTYKKIKVHYDFELLGGKKGWPNRHYRKTP